MKKYTQAEFDAIPRDENGVKHCPTGDYSQVKAFGAGCSFDADCNFGADCIFGTWCIFGAGCSFDAGYRRGRDTNAVRAAKKIMKV